MKEFEACKSANSFTIFREQVLCQEQNACEYNVRWSRRTHACAVPAGHPARDAVWRVACEPELVASVACGISLQYWENEDSKDEDGVVFPSNIGYEWLSTMFW